MVEKRWSDNDLVEIQVKVPVCLTLRMERADAESMLKDELCDVVDCVLNDAQETLARVDDDHAGGGVLRLAANTEAMRQVCVEWEFARHWDSLPDDECDITVTEDGLFPERTE